MARIESPRLAAVVWPIFQPALGSKPSRYASSSFLRPPPGLGFGLRQSTFPLVRPRQSAQSAGKAVSPRRPIKRQSGLFWAAKCCFWPRTSHFLGGVLAQFWPWFRAICRRFLAMVWSQIGNFSPAARLLSGVPPEPPRQTLSYRGAREKVAKNGWILPGQGTQPEIFPAPEIFCPG